jgi:hypothetical protein
LSLYGATVTTAAAVASQEPRDVTLLAQRLDGAAAAVELKIAVPKRRIAGVTPSFFAPAQAFYQR